MTDPLPLAPGTLLADKFRIVRLMGAGAMGAVYAIDHELTHHKRALKLLHPALRNVPDLVRRFLNEASAAGRAGNPHLVETFDAGTLPTGEPYLVMELLVGEPLDSILKRERRLDIALASELVAQAAEGMNAAHHAGIIHRDLKPENLFVTTRDGGPFIKILDFGVSKFAAVSADQMKQTRAGMVYGSPAYMSPEQLSAAPDIDPRTDVFALGVVLYQCLTGVLPFDGPTLEALAMRVLAGEPPPLLTLRPELPVALVEVVNRSLAPLRDNRIPTARALASALGPFRGPGPVSWPSSVEFGHAATVASDAPMGPSVSTAPAAMAAAGAVSALGARVASAGPMVASPSLTASLPRNRAALPIVAGLAVILVAVIAVLWLGRLRTNPPVAAALGPPSAPVSVILTASPPPVPSVAVTLTPPVDSAAIGPSREHSSGRTAEPRKPVAGPTPVATPIPSAAASSSARPSAAHNLGLSEDNPFR